MKLPSYLRLLSIIIVLSLTMACSKDENTPRGPSGTNNPSTNPSEWLIPENEVRDGGPGKDGIPSVDAPVFSDVPDISFLNNNDLVIGYKVGNEIRAYPHPILDWHEIVNDGIAGKKFAITYCPLTGTGIAWNRKLNGEETTFGVSGLLYNSNLIPYDRKTDSNWSQMRLECVNGELANTSVETYPVFETSWATWKKMFPGSKVMTRATGFNRAYGNYPYGAYRENEALIFGVTPDDSRLHRKERVLGIIIDGEAKTYRFKDFDDQNVNVLNDEYKSKKVVIVGSKADNYLMAFERVSSGGATLEFTAIQGEASVVMQDNEGNKYNIFGEMVEGNQDILAALPKLDSYIGYWFAWGAFYPNPSIHGQ